jgi:hypothetical protein
MGAFWQGLANSGVMNFAQLQSIAVPRSRPDAERRIFVLNAGVHFKAMAAE